MGNDTRARSKTARRPRFDVVGFGALNLDHLYAVPELVRDGGVEVTESTAQPGGSAANTTYGLARLGLRCGFVGTVGDDNAGRTLLASFEEVGVDTSGIRVAPGVETGRTICITAGQKQKAIYILPGANNLLDSREIDLAYIGDARHVHLSSFVGDDAFSEQVRIVQELPAGVRVSLALDSLYARRGLHAISSLLTRCAVLFANAEELQELTGEDPRRAACACLEAGCAMVVITFGSGSEAPQAMASSHLQGATASLIVTRRKTARGPETVEHAVPAVKAHTGAIVDTTGAGDAFAAGFLCGLLATRYGPAKCGALGHTAAGFSLTALGARRGLPTRQDLLRRFNDRFRVLLDRVRSTESAPSRHGTG